MSVRFILVFVTLLSPTYLFSQWEFTGGPEGGAGYGIIKHGDEIFAATFNGVYRSSTMGDSWTPSGLPGKTIFRMLSAGENIYASADNVLFQSTDDGMTWQETFTTGGTRVQALVYHKEEIYLSVYQEDGGDEFGGVYRSGDGKTWTRVTNGAHSSYVRALLSVDFYLVAVTYADGIFRTNNRGETWTTSTINLSEIPTIRTARADNGRIYAAGENAVFLTSSNYGSTWQAITANGIREWDTFYDVQRAGNKFYAITIYSDTLYISTDNGITWQPDLSADLPHNQYAITSKLALSLVDNKLFCQMDIGTFSTSANVLDWEYSGAGIVNAFTTSLASFNGTIYAGSLGGPFRSTDDGMTWITPEDSSQLRWRSCNVRAKGDALYAYGEEGVWRHNGSSWSTIASDFTYDVEQHGDTLLWTVGYPGIFYSTDNGATQFSANGNGPEALPKDTTSADRIFFTGTAYIAQIGFWVDSPGYSYLEDKLYRSGDGMQTWQLITPVSLGSVHSFLNVGNTLYAAMYTGLLRSTDDGKSWQRVTSISNEAYVEAIASVNGLLLLSIFGDASLPDGIYKSTDDGFSWIFAGDGSQTASAFLSHKGYLFASIDAAGVWKRSLAELDVRKASATEHHQPIIYPNPATASIMLQGDATKIIVRSTLGAIVWESAVSESEQLHLPRLAKGMYVAEIIGKTTRYEKLIVK